MRKERKQPKTRQAVAIPAALLDFLRDVHKMIRAGDEAATIESDDLMQCEAAFGGLMQHGGSRYSFTYFPEEGIRQKWEFDLDAVDIARIAEGTQTELVLWGCRGPECRCMFSDPENTCFDCDYVEEP